MVYSRPDRQFVMKRAATILTFMLAINLVYAQEGNQKSVLGISSGISIPFDTFDNKTMTNNAGFAGAGANLEIDFLRYLEKFFGITSTIGYSNISLNESAYKAEYDRILNNYGETVVDAGNYQVLKGMLGLIIIIPATKQAEVLLVIQLGFAMSVHPDIVVSNSELGEINSVGKNIAWSPLSSAGLKFNYRLSEKYGISLNYNLNYTTPGFHDDYDDTGPGTGTGGAFSLPVRYQNINIGFVMNL